ncbi:MAG TPA: hypothetical protein VFG20_08940 [Planctomycetaceae bacterium]|jgi:hypothetical protein|nr:hypothetical protein [Planctomycetaceae bacterium]
MLLDQDRPEVGEHRGPRGRTIGLIASGDHARILFERLVEHGFQADHITLLTSESSIPVWEDFIGSDQWGEQAEMLHDQGLGTLKEGGTIFVVDVPSPEQAQLVADVASACGGHSVHYFGNLVDIQLTA